ncbi:MAG: hypothetical protein VKL20_05035 [Synechocystis sp.]|nr:hypothetical protein [Synechocystis sp.]
MTYLDPKRLAKIEAFQQQVETRQPLSADWSPEQVLASYHRHYYGRYFQQSKIKRRQKLSQTIRGIGEKNAINIGITVVRTALMEGLVLEPSTEEMANLQALWWYLHTEEGSDDNFSVTDRYLGPLILYYQGNQDKTPSLIQRRQKQLVQQLSQRRNQIAQRSLQGYSNQPLAPLWQWVMLFDQEEADHLVSLGDSDYYDSDYWREFTQYYQQQHGDRCPFCGAQSPLFLHNPHRQYRGQEFFFPQIVTCRCQQCADQ